MISELQQLVNLVCEAEGCQIPDLQIKEVRRGGRYHRRTHSITLPKWVLVKPVEYLWYYVIHETIHAIGYRGHGKLFKERERRWLKEFGIVPVYAKVYPKKLQSLNGQTFCKKIKGIMQ